MSELEPRHRLDSLAGVLKRTAHDLNNVFSSVQTFAELALPDARDGVATDLADILEANRQGIGLARRLYPPLPPLDPSATEDLVPLLRTLCPEARVTVEGPTVVRGRPEHLGFALEPLLANAREAAPATPPEVKLWRAEVAAPPPDGWVGCRPGAYVGVEISDRGAGIPDRIWPQIGEPFATTKPERERGFGLWRAYLAVRALGGELALRKRSGGGTEAVVLFPAPS